MNQRTLIDVPQHGFCETMIRAERKAAARRPYLRKTAPPLPEPRQPFFLGQMEIPLIGEHRTFERKDARRCPVHGSLPMLHHTDKGFQVVCGSAHMRKGLEVSICFCTYKTPWLKTAALALRHWNLVIALESR